MTGKGYALGAQVRTTSPRTCGRMVARLESSGRRWWSWWWWTLASADPAQAHVGEGKKLELPVIRPWLARALAWPGLLACCPSKSPSGRC